MDIEDVFDRLLAATRHLGADVGKVDVPEAPAVYVWWREGEPLHLGAAESLRSQLLDWDLRGGQSPMAPVRKVVSEQLRRDGQLQAGQSRAERIATIDRFLAACEVSWVTVDHPAQAHELVAPLSARLFGSSEWEPRRGEDQLLRRYLDGLEQPGLVYVEVPIGASPGRRGRRIDAVRFPRLGSDVQAYDPDVFPTALASGQLELIEVKQALNRPVFGQLLIARELAVVEWDLPASAELSCVALVASSDPVLEPIFARYGLRVIIDGT